jgi:hypothetical protein
VLNVPDARPTMPGEGAPPDVVTRYFDQLDLYDHYTRYTSRKDNYHYFGAGRNQLVPLRSQPWPDGTPRRRLGNYYGYTATDLFGCHGTSGSGVLEVQPDGSYKLLGPMAVAGPGWDGRLCTDPATFQKGQTNLAYTRNDHVRTMVSRFNTQILFDRIVPPWLSLDGSAPDESVTEHAKAQAQ